MATRSVQCQNLPSDHRPNSSSSINNADGRGARPLGTAAARRPGVNDIRIPSERAFRSRERALREGLEIDRMVFDALVALRAR